MSGQQMDSSPTATPRTSLTHALVRTGSAPSPGTFLRCRRACIVEDQLLVWLVNFTDATNDVPLVAEAISGKLPVVGSVVRCSQRAESYVALEATNTVPRSHWIFRIPDEDRMRVLLHVFAAYEKLGEK